MVRNQNELLRKLLLFVRKESKAKLRICLEDGKDKRRAHPHNVVRNLHANLVRKRIEKIQKESRKRDDTYKHKKDNEIAQGGEKHSDIVSRFSLKVNSACFPKITIAS